MNPGSNYQSSSNIGEIIELHAGDGHDRHSALAVCRIMACGNEPDLLIGRFQRFAHVCKMADDCCTSKGSELEQAAWQNEQRRVLVAVLIVNAVMFVVEFGAGLVAGSTALMDDALDNLGDTLVYGVSLYAISRSDRWKAGAAAFKGAFILLLGASIVVNVAIKIASGITPSSTLMLVFGGMALVANLTCLALLWKFRRHDLKWQAHSNARAMM